jgi:hypothetical protein
MNPLPESSIHTHTHTHIVLIIFVILIQDLFLQVQRVVPLEMFSKYEDFTLLAALSQGISLTNIQEYKQSHIHIYTHTNLYSLIVVFQIQTAGGVRVQDVGLQ